MSAENHNTKEKLSLLFLINNLGRGGAERAFVNQANYLEAAGHDVFFATIMPEKEGTLEKELNLPPDRKFYVRYRGLYDREALRSFKKIIQAHKIQTIYATLEQASIVARLLKIILPQVMVVRRESGTGTVDEQGRPSLKLKKFKLIDMALNFWVDKIVVLSDEMKGLASKYQPWNRSKIAVIGNGVIMVDGREEVLEQGERKMHDKNWRLMAAASMDVMERAFEYIIDAIALIPDEERRNFKLAFAGDGRLRSFYEERVRSRGVGGAVEFMGKLDTENMRAQYRNSHIFILSSLSEGFPNVLLEAGSFGLPSITTRAGGAVDLISDGENGFFVPFKDASAIAEKIRWYKNHPEKWLTMSAASYDRAKNNFDMSVIMNKIISVLRPGQ